MALHATQIFVTDLLISLSMTVRAVSDCLVHNAKAAMLMCNRFLCLCDMACKVESIASFKPDQRGQ